VRVRNGVLPELVVLVRDFELGLPEGIRNPTEYLDSTLVLEAVDDDDDDAKEKMAANKIKKSVMECFPKHHCFTLPHPLHGAGAGASIHHLGTEHGKVSADFRRQVASVVEVSVLNCLQCALLPLHHGMFLTTSMKGTALQEQFNRPLVCTCW
jgi:hypothetical protein